MKAGFIFLIAISAAQAQVYPGGYPGGYPGQYPTGPTIPLPRRTKQTKQSKDSKGSKTNAPLPNFRGMLKQMDDKTITLQLDDNRILDFQRTDKTKFFKNGEELKTPAFAAGDQISVEGTQEEAGYYSAVNVYWEKAGSAAAKSGGGGSSVPDTWKDAPQDKPKDAPKETAAAPAKPAPAKPDPSDPGPPVIRRGKPADPAREKSGPLPPETASNTTPARNTEAVRPSAPAEATQPGTPVSEPSILRGDEEVHIGQQRPSDPLIRKAVEASLDFTETLPSYVCQEMISRFQSETSPANWRALDIVTTNLVYESGKEDYRDIAINGKPTKKKMEELGGAWSTGEFGSVLVDVLSPATAADFRFRRDSRIAGMNTKEYDFSVKRENSHWVIHMGGQRYTPAYDGRIWIDPSTGRVLRIEMEAKGFPDEFPTDHVESATDYQYVRLGDLKQYLLPVHAETLSCQRGTNYCARNTIDFRNYKKYTGESTIEYTDVNSTVKFDDKAKTEEKKK